MDRQLQRVTPSSESPGNISLAASARGDWRAILWGGFLGISALHVSPVLKLLMYSTKEVILMVNSIHLNN